MLQNKFSILLAPLATAALLAACDLAWNVGTHDVPDGGPSPAETMDDAGHTARDDAGDNHAGDEDAGLEDAGLEDAGLEDATAMDAGLEDAGAGDVDSGSPMSDSGVDAGACTGAGCTTAQCGDGVVAPSETCDTALPADMEGACPAACDDGVVCTEDRLIGSGCSATCSAVTINACRSGDGCCPAGCYLPADGDCTACEPGAWTFKHVPSFDEAQYVALDVDVLGNAHAAFANGSGFFYAQLEPFSLWRGTWPDTTWSYGSLDADAIGDLHVSYFDLSSNRLRYAHHAAGDDLGTWTLGSIGEMRDDGFGTSFTSLAVDDAGGVHVAYPNHSGDGDLDLHHAYRSPTTGTWTTTIVDDEDPESWGSGNNASLAIDDAGGVHVSYTRYASTNGPLGVGLMYAYRDPSGAWTTAPILEGGQYGYTSIDVDDAGGVYVAYYRATRLELAHRPAGGVWSIAVVDDGGSPVWLRHDVGQFASLDVDARGGVHIAYYDRTDAKLKYAHRASAADPWSLMIVDRPDASAGHDAGRYASLAVDAAGGVHIGYRLSVEMPSGIVNGLNYAYRCPALAP